MDAYENINEMITRVSSHLELKTVPRLEDCPTASRAHDSNYHFTLSSSCPPVIEIHIYFGFDVFLSHAANKLHSHSVPPLYREINTRANS